MLNSHHTALVRTFPADFIPTDAPDPRVAVLGYGADIPPLRPWTLQESAAVTCALLMKDQQRWHAGVAFDHYPVSPEWLEHLFNTLRSADLPEFAGNLRNHSTSQQKARLDVRPLDVAIAVDVISGGKRECHLFCSPEREPSDWRGLLDAVGCLQSQDRCCSTLTYFDAFMGDPDAADWVARTFELQLAEQIDARR